MKESDCFREATKTQVAGTNVYTRKYCISTYCASWGRLYVYTFPNSHQKTLSPKISTSMLDNLVYLSAPNKD